MKGIYFSLDALLASLILLALTTLIISYDQPANSKDSYEAGMLYASSVQPVNRWNNSIQSQRTVLGYIHHSYYIGQTEESEAICRSYFSIPNNMTLYFIGNSTDKICGPYKPTSEPVSTAETITGGQYINDTLIGPRKAVLVIPN